MKDIFNICKCSHFSKIIGYHNYWSLAFGSAFLSAWAAIHMEQPKRRGPLAIYVSYVV